MSEWPYNTQRRTLLSKTQAAILSQAPELVSLVAAGQQWLVQGLAANVAYSFNSLWHSTVSLIISVAKKNPGAMDHPVILLWACKGLPNVRFRG